MDSEIDELAALECKHRKEKKELQAQIQALKKASKNDKTKKKELTAEIARLEAEMDSRHQQEIESANKDVNEDEPVLIFENELSKVKITKAQKRRDKKSQHDREREELIKLQEHENLHGPRNIELQEINTKLKERGLKIFSIPSDGDCLYKAISHQMTVKYQKDLSVDELRKSIANYIRQNKDDFMPFMSNPETYDMLSSEEFEEYCDKIEGTKVWGGQLEIRASSNFLKCPITVIQATGPSSIDQGTEFDGPPLVITYHRHMFGLGEHYNSTTIGELD